MVLLQFCQPVGPGNKRDVQRRREDGENRVPRNRVRMRKMKILRATHAKFENGPGCGIGRDPRNTLEAS